MVDLVDIFGPSGQSEAPPSDDLWDTQPSCPVTSDPWESVCKYFFFKVLPLLV